MADKLLRALVSIPRDTLLPEDVVVNTFYFDGDSGNTEAEYKSGVSTLLTTFYQAIDNTLLSANLASPAHVKVYDMRDAEPRVPWYEFDIALTLSTAAYPGEVALVLSFHAALESGTIPARRRGRVYIGPLASDQSTGTSGEVRPNSTAITTLTNAGHTLAQGLALGTAGSMKWAVFSPTSLAGGASLDDSFNDVVGGWVDNAFDTQRRRGSAATARTTYTN